HARYGVAFGVTDQANSLTLDGFYCENNLMLCSDAGIYINATLGTNCQLYHTTLAQNRIEGELPFGGIFVVGVPDILEITDNAIAPTQVGGPGISVNCTIGTGRVRIGNNHIVFCLNGIELLSTADSLLEDVSITGNRLRNLIGIGIVIDGRFGS